MSRHGARYLTEHANGALGLGAAIAATVALVAIVGWMKWGSSGSDFQRLNALEARVDQLEAAP